MINLKYDLSKIKNENRTSSFENEFHLFSKIKDKRFGDASLLKNNNGDFIVLKNKILKNEKEFNLFLKNIKLKNSIKCGYIHNLLDISIYINSGLCNINYIVKLFFEYYPDDLDNIFNQKIDDNSEFSNIELTHILYQISWANKYLQEIKLFSGDIRPENIYYDKNTNLFKIINRIEEKEDFYDNIDKVQRKNLISNKKIYISPNLFKYIKRPSKNFKYNKNKEDIFSIGLMILCLGLKKNSNELYNYMEGKFDTDKLGIWLECFKEKYYKENNFLITTIETMLIIDEEERPDFFDFFSKIPKYEEVKKELELINNLDTPIKEELNEENEANEEIEVNNQQETNEIDDITIKYPILQVEKDVIFNNIHYLWDEEYYRHYYFDKKINDYEWYYDHEDIKEIDSIRKQQNNL